MSHASAIAAIWLGSCLLCFGHAGEDHTGVSLDGFAGFGGPEHDGWVSGDGALRFEVLYTRDHLPEQAQPFIEKLHGGFGVARGDGLGETYFAVPGAGIVRLSADLGKAELVSTHADMLEANMHNATVWLGAGPDAYVTYSGNDVAKVFTTSLNGELIYTLPTPGPDHAFADDTVNAYFADGGAFVPTDADYRAGRLYVTTGYSSLDYVLTASVDLSDGVAMSWTADAFGGRGEGAGQFGTGHGVTISPDGSEVHVADRPNGEIDQFSLDGEYTSTLRLPDGAWPADVDYEGGYGVVGCLFGKDRDRGAPIYLLKDGEVVSTIWAKDELGLGQFQHIHDAVIREVDGVLYIIAQAWNPGDFAVLRQVT
jgi:hypothetical protein